MISSFRRTSIFFAVLAVVAVHIFPPSAAARDPYLNPGGLLVAILDVGQGDGSFIQTPSGRNILIDAGPDARRGIIPFLRSRKIDQIDVMVLTHPHSDHIGGADILLDSLHIKEVLDCGAGHPGGEYMRLLKKIQRNGILYRQPRAGDKLNWDAALDVTVLHPDDPNYSDFNDNSIVIRVVYDRTAFLFMGDAGAAAEDVILSRFGGDIRSDVLKVGHHGSMTASTPEFLDSVRPQYAVVSAGYSNSFGHPKPAVLNKLAAVHAKVLRTDIDGFLFFKTDGREIKWMRSPLPFFPTTFDPGPPAGISGPEWSGPARPELNGVSIYVRRTLSVWPETNRPSVYGRRPMNTWMDTTPFPRHLRRVPPTPEWSCAVSVAPLEGRGTECGLILSGDTFNYVQLGVRDERMICLTVVRNGRTFLGPESVVGGGNWTMGFRRHAAGLDALVYDENSKIWKTVWSLSPGQLPQVPKLTHVGVYGRTWSRTYGAIRFKDFRMRSGT